MGLKALSSKDEIEDNGYVIVDQTDSYYPLVFHSKQRELSFLYSLEDIQDGFDQIFDKLSELNTMDDWKPEFQQELFKLFPDKPHV